MVFVPEWDFSRTKTKWHARIKIWKWRILQPLMATPILIVATRLSRCDLWTTFQVPYIVIMWLNQLAENWLLVWPSVCVTKSTQTPASAVMVMSTSKPTEKYLWKLWLLQQKKSFKLAGCQGIEVSSRQCRQHLEGVLVGCSNHPHKLSAQAS